MKHFISSFLCLVVGVSAGWFMVRGRVKTELDANMTRTVIMNVSSREGQERTFTASGLRMIADQYLADHHTAVQRDGIGLVVHTKHMDVDSHPIFATIVYFRGDQGCHAVDIGPDGIAVRGYAIETANPN